MTSIFSYGKIAQSYRDDFCSMLLQDKQSGALVEILDINDLINPVKETVPGRIQSGQEEQDPENMAKENLSFPSGEALPRCWVDAEYQLKDS